MQSRFRVLAVGAIAACVSFGSPANGEVVRWVAIGDTGSNCTFVDARRPKETWKKAASTGQQTLVARHLADIVKKDSIRDILFLGDNFYPHGLEAGPLGDACLELAFTAPYGDLLPPDHMYMIPGNHDYDVTGSIKRQLDLSGQRWTFVTRPRLIHLVPGLFDIVMFDSPLLILDSRVHDEFVRDLTAQISESRAPWLALAAHHPLETIGKHSYWSFFGRFNKNDYASSTNRAYRSLVRRAIQNAKRPVQLFLAGHDHSLQFIHDDDKEENFPDYHVVSGAGGKTSYVHSVSASKWGRAVPGFVVMEIDTERPNVLVLRYMDSQQRKQIRRFEIKIDPFEPAPTEAHAVPAEQSRSAP